CSNNAKINLNSWFNLCHNTLNTFAETDGETLIYQTPEFVAKKSKKHKINLSAEFQPESWINIPAPTEDLLSKPYTPSKTESDEEADSVSPLTQEGNFYRRGTLIHKILQFIPNTLYDREAIIDKFLQKNAADFPAYQQQQIKSEVIKLLNNPDFSFIFAEDSHPEVPIIGEVDGKIISAQIDRLIVLPDKIVIVDFKTNRPAAADITQTPEVYINQLQTYAKLISKIYPNRKVESYILWTNETRLMKVA
ncbi:MAG: PD-(D/E)XK nuclease family protein, partial [Alphaproteobacteria bacterium]|nr:PD-(D/E)XK nuclease family protein [Alphaproteobacteria bacterium]